MTKLSIYHKTGLGKWAILSLLFSCASTSSTNITGSWKDPESGTYSNIFVAVLSKNFKTRGTLETDITAKLKKLGVKVVPSLDVFPHSEKVETQEEKQAAVEKIASLGHDAIITVRLLKQTEESRYVGGKTQYAPTNMGYGTGYNNRQNAGAIGPGNYGAFGTYYVDNYQVSSTPGHDEAIKIYFIESRLFDTKTGKVVWSVQTQTFDPANIGSASAELSDALVNSLKTNKLLAEKSK